MHGFSAVGGTVTEGYLDLRGISHLLLQLKHLLLLEEVIQTLLIRIRHQSVSVVGAQLKYKRQTNKVLRLVKENHAEFLSFRLSPHL